MLGAHFGETTQIPSLRQQAKLAQGNFVFFALAQEASSYRNTTFYNKIQRMKKIINMTILLSFCGKNEVDLFST